MKQRFLGFLGFLVLVFATCIGGVSFAQVELRVLPAVGGAATTFTLEQLLAVPQAEIDTENEFVDGKKVFRGPLVRDILDLSGATSAQFVMLTAANDYQVEIDVAEFDKYGAILALSVDGVLLSMRDKGPIWLIYPMSDFVELRDPVYNSRLIWQLITIEYR